MMRVDEYFNSYFPFIGSHFFVSLLFQRFVLTLGCKDIKQTLVPDIPTFSSCLIKKTNLEN